MIWIAISAFVLACVACSCAAAAWRISATSKRDLELWRSTTASEVQRWRNVLAKSQSNVAERLLALQAQTPAILAAEVAALSDAVTKVGDTHRRFAGKVWAEIQHRGGGGGEATNRELPAGTVYDSELAAMLALQAPPK